MSIELKRNESKFPISITSTYKSTVSKNFSTESKIASSISTEIEYGIAKASASLEVSKTDVTTLSSEDSIEHTISYDVNPFKQVAVYQYIVHSKVADYSLTMEFNKLKYVEKDISGLESKL